MELIGGILHDENTITGLPLLSSPAKKIYYQGAPKPMSDCPGQVEIQFGQVNL